MSTTEQTPLCKRFNLRLPVAVEPRCSRHRRTNVSGTALARSLIPIDRADEVPHNAATAVGSPGRWCSIQWCSIQTNDDIIAFAARFRSDSTTALGLYRCSDSADPYHHRL